MGYSGAGGKLIHEKKNQKQKISWHWHFKTPFYKAWWEAYEYKTWWWDSFLKAL
jgi:hypothetical protein